MFSENHTKRFKTTVEKFRHLHRLHCQNMAQFSGGVRGFDVVDVVTMAGPFNVYAAQVDVTNNSCHPTNYLSGPRHPFNTPVDDITPHSISEATYGPCA